LLKGSIVRTGIEDMNIGVIVGTMSTAAAAETVLVVVVVVGVVIFK
jgi:hypothetical protein